MKSSGRRLTEEEQAAILVRYRRGEAGTAIARSLGISGETVYRIIRAAGLIRQTAQVVSKKTGISQAGAEKGRGGDVAVQKCFRCESCEAWDLYSVSATLYAQRCEFCGGVMWRDDIPEKLVIERLHALCKRLELGEAAT
jgi:hypothetical protein